MRLYRVVGRTCISSVDTALPITSIYEIYAQRVLMDLISCRRSCDCTVWWLTKYYVLWPTRKLSLQSIRCTQRECSCILLKYVILGVYSNTHTKCVLVYCTCCGYIGWRFVAILFVVQYGAMHSVYLRVMRVSVYRCTFCCVVWTAKQTPPRWRAVPLSV